MGKLFSIEVNDLITELQSEKLPLVSDDEVYNNHAQSWNGAIDKAIEIVLDSLTNHSGG